MKIKSKSSLMSVDACLSPCHEEKLDSRDAKLHSTHDEIHDTRFTIQLVLDFFNYNILKTNDLLIL